LAFHRAICLSSPHEYSSFSAFHPTAATSSEWTFPQRFTSRRIAPVVRLGRETGRASRPWSRKPSPAQTSRVRSLSDAADDTRATS
jgi:hypothetical protein